MQTSIQAIRHIQLLTLGLILLLVSTLTNQSYAQEVGQKEVVAEIYALTKKCKTESDYSALLEKCDSALTRKLSEKNTVYVNALAAWGFNRRGELRLATSEKLNDSSQLEQSDAALVEAFNDFDAAVRRDPKRARAWHFRGVANVKQNRLEDAIGDFTKLIKIKPGQMNAYFNRAEARYEVGQYDSANEDYDRVIENDSGDVAALTGRAHCNYALAKYEDAFRDYDVVVQLNPTSGIALVNRGDAFRMLGKWTDSLADYKEAIRASQTGIAYQRAAWLLATCPEKEIVQPEIAIEYCKSAIRLDGETPKNLDTMAAAEAELGNFKAAKDLQQRAMALTESLDKEMQARMALYERGQVYKQATIPKRMR